MNITQMAFEFIAKNPDQKMRDIIAAFPDCKPVSVKSAVYRLYTEGRLETKATSCGFIYRVINDASCCADLQDDFKSRGNLEQEKAAKKLEERSLYRRAATVWHQLSTSSCSQKTLEYYIRQKNACLRKARMGKSRTECLLAGNYCGGDLCID
ncbi:PerC family transcriptional regulator [Klebsiella pneumoniae]|uniref:PerC family transcriptional regulator n=1 Tax=Klebsiella pneumoniae TaxID=573 RepID=UPI00298C5AE2|nr:PerC family transcriptional regulator [Klebsiella pneumoniae]MDW6116070.1 PerC family transcriptional regulator [Klebsiella pneumoniae]